MNLNFLIKKNHIFKRRKKTQFKYNYSKNNSGIYTYNQFKFEFIYLKIIKKLFRKKYLKKTRIFFKSKFWVMIKPNFLLTMKSKNSRMGSGTGLYVRVCSIVKANKPIILLRNYSYLYIWKVIHYFKLKLNINAYLFYKKIKKNKLCIN